MCANVRTLVAHVYNILILYAHWHDNNKQYKSVRSTEQVCF